MLTLRDYADGAWRFIAVCEGCGRETRVAPGDVLARSAWAHGGIALDDVAGLVPCPSVWWFCAGAAGAKARSPARGSAPARARAERERLMVVCLLLEKKVTVH